MDVKSSVLSRYSEGAKQKQAALCCPVSYNTDLLKIIPQEIIDRDYGCGDPSHYVKPGDTVLDLGSGGGKICYITAQLVGGTGQVIGVDMNDDMLALARKYQDEMATKLGNHRVTFKKGYIQDLALGIEARNSYLENNPVNDQDSMDALLAWETEQRKTNPLIADNSIDVVVSNCVLNLVDDKQKQQLIEEIHRVLKPGGRIAISDIVSNKAVPPDMKQDAELWSGCISGVFEELEFIEKFNQAGFYGLSYDKWDTVPWKVINDIEFRSVTLTGHKPASLNASDSINRVVIYKGPFKEIIDDNDNIFVRGKRIEISSVQYYTLKHSRLGDAFVFLSEGKMVTDTDETCCSSPSTDSEASSCC